jgi:hypothetical protein
MSPVDPLTGEAITWPPPPSAAAGSTIGASEDDSNDCVTPCAISAAGVANEKMQNTSAVCLIKRGLRWDSDLLELNPDEMKNLWVGL